MKAAAAGQPGRVQIIEFPDRTAGVGEVVLATLACGVCATDLKTVQKGSDNPDYALGHEIVGRVIDSGPGSGWQIGQRVVAAPYLPCGSCRYCRAGQPTLCRTLFEISIYPGGMAEKVFIPGPLARRGLIPVPDNLPDEVASLAEPLGCVLKGIEDSSVSPGDATLVIGDGPMGVLAASAARAYGAFPVLISGMTPHRMERARGSFADVVIDANQADVAGEVKQHTGGCGADAVIVTVSSAQALETGIRCVRPGGVVNAFAGVPEGTTIPLDVRRLHYQQYTLTGSFGTAPDYMAKALRLLEHRKVDGNLVITACFPFPGVEEAVEYAVERRGLKAVVTF